MKHLKLVVLLLLLMGSLAGGLILPALLASPAATMSLSTGHAAEGSTVTITLGFTGYTSGQKLNYTIQVTNPNAQAATASKVATIASGGTATLSFSYASQFSSTPAPNTNLNGTYSAKILLTNDTFGTHPTNSFNFTVGPADQTSYQRTQTVNILANGYTPNDFAVVNITFGGTSVSGFPHNVKISSVGVASYSWKVPVGQGLGNYVVEVSGNSTKSILDEQSITIQLATISVKGLSGSTASGKAQSSFVRGDTRYAIFNATYPDGTVVTTGTDSVELISPNNIVTTLSATYNSSENQYLTSSYSFNISARTGSWTLRIVANTIVDVYSNKGPTSNLNSTFTLQPLTLKTSITALKTVYNRTVTFNVNATVSYPTSDSFNASSGVVFANLTGGTPLTLQNLTYNSVTLKWTGSITIPPNYPLISATLQVSAHDRFGNTGTNTTFQITIKPTTIIVHQIPFKVNGTSFQPFQTIGVQINATYINNQSLIKGPGGLGGITFHIPGGKSITVGLTLQPNGTLTGQYVIGDTVPLGRWNLTIGPWELNDGYGNTNSKSVLGPIINILPVQLRFDSSYFKAPGNNTITGDKVTLGASFLYPNGSSTKSLIVNTTIFANGQNNNYTFTYDSGTMKYLTTIDTTGWAPGRYQVNITAYFADYRGSHIVWITVKPTPFLLGPIVGALLILVIVGVGAVEYSRRGKVTAET